MDKLFCDAIDTARDENAHGVGVRNGKRYTTVAVRVEIARRFFGPIGISTEIVEFGRDKGAHIIVKATITAVDGRVMATGHAEEIRGQGMVNTTSALENAETSAIGRALAALGLAGGEFASANEMDAVERKTRARADGEPSPVATPAATMDFKALNDELDRIAARLDAATSLDELGAIWKSEADAVKAMHRISPEHAVAAIDAKDRIKAALATGEMMQGAG